MYRMYTALSSSIDNAVRFAGIAFNLLVVYAGYITGKPQLLSQKIWFGWIYYVNPIAYSFEAVISNEFSDKVLDCAPDEIVPRGAGYTNPAYQGCAFTGVQIGFLRVSGAIYLVTAFEYTRSHLWRNFGVIIAFTALYILVTAFASKLFSFTSGGGGALEYKRSKAAKHKVKPAEAPTDIEKGSNGRHPSNTSTATPGSTADGEALQKISGSESIFTWQNLEYTVPYRGGERKLLNNVIGYVKPGLMVTLVGVFGAGKTTLLNTLSQRQKIGVIKGNNILVDGRPLDVDFQRSTGFCRQIDLHDGSSTIREGS